MADVPPAGSNPSSGEDWPAQAADTIVNVVGMVRDRTTGTAVTAARAVVFGLLAAILGLTGALLAMILVMRGMVIVVSDLLSLVDHNQPGRAVWIVDLGLGLVLLGLGALLWKKAVAAPAASAD